jgi:hypothetical protein
MASPQLYFTASIEEQWQSLVGPWLREQARTAWSDPRPTVILAPTRAEGFYLRSRLVEEGINFIGLRFWTPSDARAFLTGELSPNIGAAAQPELRLLARLAAEKLLKKSSADDAIINSTAQEPDPFLRAYELLLGAGWEPDIKGAPYGRKLAAELKRLLKENNLATQSGIHRNLRSSQASANRAILLANLLVVGFNATHWPLWDLLQAVVSSAQQATISLSRPRRFGQSLDELWTGSWEEILRVPVEVPEGPVVDAISPFADLVTSYEDGTSGDISVSDLTFLVAPDLATQAQGIILKVIDYLKHDSCTRLGIVFPELNALALEVVAQLTKLGIPLDDGTRAIQPGIFERRAWTTWIDLQQEPSVGKLSAWLRACESQGLSCGLGDLSARDAIGLLDGALGETLVDDLDFLVRYLEEKSPRRHVGELIDFLHQRIVLPPIATFSEFFSLTLQMLNGNGWQEHHASLKTEPSAWLMESKEIFSRRTFLDWLKESTDSRTQKRDGNHFYGKVHLLIYAQMTGQTWSHLILTGLNEGVWPRVFESEAFGSRHELIALNEAAKSLNSLSRTQGRQGQGHETVKAGHSHCLLPLERLSLSLRDLCAALEGTGQAVCLAAMTTETGRSLLPSDFFNHAYHAKVGQVLDEEVFRSLANQTVAWIDNHGKLFPSTSGHSLEIAATCIAFEARRDIAQPFGPYEFSFKEPPVRPIQLSCKKWEDAWNHPSQVWLDEIVGVSSWPEGRLIWPQAVGTWVHRWLASALRECRENNSLSDFLPRLRAVARDQLVRTQNLAKVSGLALYPWWEQVWGQAESIALGLGESLVLVLQDKIFLTEYSLPENIRVALPGSSISDFALTGRMDLLVVEPGARPCDPPNSDFTGCTCWVIDFKTGAAASLTAKKVGEGSGLQPVLYALAARARGAGPVAISLHTFTTPLKEQVQLDDALAMTDLFRSLDTLHRSGIFGMRDDAQNAYGFSPTYPMATRYISPEILDAKWERVHGSASVNPGEDE